MRIRHLNTEKKREAFMSRLVYAGRIGGAHHVETRNGRSAWEIRPDGSVWYSPVNNFVWDQSERVRGIEAKLVKMAAFPHYLEDEI
jgi:hypothetical protein